MNNIKFTDNELQLMSYQELRRLSILLRLPANIKKKYMISMIQAHQKGDGCTKTAIANKVMEERKVKKLNNKGKQAKPFIMVSTTTSKQQIPTDLSVSTKHEVEARFSYVAHFTSKENASSGISRIIKEEAEVSRRNRSILQQPRKSSRELSAVGRTEIMLPRNHSLTTPVRVMPQFERGFSGAPGQYDPAQGLPNSKTNFPEGSSYNYHFHGEFSNAMIPSSTQELHRSEAYWHTRDMYNNSLMPILSSLLSPVSINSSTNASHYSSSSGSVAGPPSFQNIYEKYIKNGTIMDNQTLQSSSSNSTVVITNPFSDDNNNSYNVSHGRYIITKNDVDFEINSALEDLTCQQYSKRDEAAVIRQASAAQSHLADFYFSQYDDSNDGTAQLPDQTRNPKKLTDRFKVESSTTELRAPQETFRTSNPSFRKSEEIKNSALKHVHLTSLLPPPSEGANEYEATCSDEEKFWEESQKSGGSKMAKEAFEETSSTGREEGERNSFLSAVSENSSDCYGETDTEDFCDKRERSDIPICMHQSLSRCRYVLGHNEYPEAVDKRSEMLPSFLSTFYTYGAYNKAYSFCKNSFTGTTETHLSPIMTSTCSSQFIPHANTQITHGSENEQHQISRPWLCLPPESQPPYSVESASYPTWSEYPDEMVNKVISHDGNHEVQVVKCRKHGCHYLYAVSNP